MGGLLGMVAPAFPARSLCPATWEAESGGGSDGYSYPSSKARYQKARPLFPALRAEPPSPVARHP